MRVVLVSNTIWPDAVGGLPRYVRELAGALVRAGCETTVLAKRVDASSPGVEEAPDGVRIVRHAVPSKDNPLFGAAYPFYAARGVRGPVRAAYGPDTVIHAHFPITALPLTLPGLRFIYTFHAPVWKELLDERQGTYVLPRSFQRVAVAAVRQAERLVVRRASRTFVLSNYMRGELAELSADAAAPAEVLAGGIDIDRFSPDSTVTRASVDSPLLFTARRLTPRTGVDRLVMAMPAILRDHPRTTLTVAGTGAMEAELRQLAATLGLSSRIAFLGHVPDESLIDWYRRATLVVMPTVRLEGFGLTSAEALSCGTPVVGTPVGATAELLGTIDPALVTRDATAEALADTVNGFLADPPRLARIGAGARARVAPAMGWDAVAGRYLEAYDAVRAGYR
jgi:glycosyltransferase involved in cell wall biosynthesis